jgi:hypothetical protein
MFRCRCAALLAFRATGDSGQQSIHIIGLDRFDVPGGAYVTVTCSAEISAKATIRHKHPRPKSGYIIACGFESIVDGQLARLPRAVEFFQIPPHTIHDAKTGTSGATGTATHVVANGMPLASSGL